MTESGTMVWHRGNRLRTMAGGSIMGKSQKTDASKRRGRSRTRWPWIVGIGLLAVVVAVVISRHPPESLSNRWPWLVAPAVDSRVSATGAGGDRSLALPRGEGFNVLFISIDTLRADHLACYGHPSIKTPNIDRLAAEGMLFTQCTSPVPITLPSHASMMTGTYPYVHGARDNGQFHLHGDNETLAERLKAAGYTTAAELAAFVLNREFGLNQGFDVYHDLYAARQLQEDPSKATPTERVAEEVCDGALNSLRRIAAQRFFLFVHFFDPHYPYEPPGRFAQQYAQRYLGEIAYVDEQIGRLIAELKSLEVDEKTLVIVTSDHGEGLGQHGEQTHMLFVYDTTLMVPLILHCPGQISAGRRVTAQVGLIDIAPTVLDFLGLEPMPDAQGESLLPLISGAAGDPGRVAYAESLVPMIDFGCAPLLAVRAGGWKYIHAPRAELYDVRVDPGELRNLASTEPERVRRMRAHLYRLMEEAPVVVGLGAARREVSPADVRKLEALGYVGSGADAGMVAGISLRELLEASGDDPKDYIDEIQLTMGAIGLHHAGNLEAAEKVYREILARSPQRAEGYWLAQSNLALVLLGQGKNEEAIEYLRAALRIRPQDGEVFTLLGEALAALGRTDEALVEFRQACAIEPVMPRTHWSYVRALRDAGEVKESMRHYRLAIEGDPSFRAAAQADQQAVAKLHVSGIGLLRQGKYAEAVETLRAAHTLDPWDLSLANDLAWILATCADDAVRDGAEAIRLSEMVQASADEENPAWLDTLAAAYAAQGRFDDAVATINQAIELARRSGADDLAAKARARRDLYAARRPYRDQP